MREVVRRRYTRVLNEGLPLPDLIIVDGGKGHMSGVLDVLENELGLTFRCWIKKNDKHQTSELLYGPQADVVPLKRIVKHFIYYIEFKMKFTVLQLRSIVKHAKNRFTICIGHC